MSYNDRSPPPLHLPSRLPYITHVTLSPRPSPSVLHTVCDQKLEAGAFFIWNTGIKCSNDNTKNDQIRIYTRPTFCFSLGRVWYGLVPRLFSCLPRLLSAEQKNSLLNCLYHFGSNHRDVTSTQLECKFKKNSTNSETAYLFSFQKTE